MRNDSLIFFETFISSILDVLFWELSCPLRGSKFDLVDFYNVWMI